MRYRIYHKPRLGEPMGYIVQQKHWWQFNWSSIVWFGTYQEAKEFLEDWKFNHTNFPTKEWLYLWKRIKNQDNKNYMENLLKKLVEYAGEAHDYVILKKDEKGFYIEYAFADGAPHDNRCLSWYHSYQPNARKRNGNWDDERLANHKKQLDENIGKIYMLSAFTCGGEEDSEAQIERIRKDFEKYHPGETFIPENYSCRVGKPAPQCRKFQCPHWTYEEPIKCACWYLKEVDPNKIQFSFTAEQLQKFIKDNHGQI